MACVCAPSLIALRDEANVVFPGRSKASDGCCASPKHTSQNPTSKHETGDAYDLTHDPAHGLNAHALADWMRLRCQKGTETRLGMIISNRRIATAWAKTVNGTTYKPWVWRPYTLPNPHSAHTHFELNIKNPATRNDKRGWFDGFTTTPSPTPEDDMTDAERNMLTDIHNRTKNLEAANSTQFPQIEARLARIESILQPLVRDGEMTVPSGNPQELTVAAIAVAVADEFHRRGAE